MTEDVYEPPIRRVMQAWMDACQAEGLEGVQPGMLAYRRSVIGPPGDLVAVLTYSTADGNRYAALVQACRGCWTARLGLDVREAVRQARLIALPLVSIDGGRRDHVTTAV